MDVFCKEFTPFGQLSLHEVCFWLHIMRDHALFIKMALDCDNQELRQEADTIYQAFADLENSAQEIGCDDDLMVLIERAIPVVKRFFAFKRHLLHLVMECRIHSHNPAAFYDHVSREALYFLKVMQRIDDCRKNPAEAMTGEMVFWTKILFEHIMFFLNMLDLSERQTAAKAVEMSKQMEELHFAAHDYNHMLWRFHPASSFSRYTGEVAAATEELRDFKAAVSALISECCLNSTMPPEMAEHVLHEAEHFLHVIELIAGQLVPSPAAKCED
ncbi:MAG: DUF2935 domain-containing protein [Negativicutes bacterium]|nr:DUF2935 domain-containing protein [Negativicutes bacterium]